MRMTEGVKTIKDRVALLLKEYPILRDSDKLLWLAYLNKYGGLIHKLGNKEYLILKSVIMNDDMPTMESVRRVRQKLQEGGQYVGKNREKMMTEESSMRRLMKRGI